MCYVQLLRLLGGLTNFRYGLPSVTGQGLMHCKAFKLQVWFSSHGMVCKPSLAKGHSPTLKTQSRLKVTHPCPRARHSIQDRVVEAHRKSDSVHSEPLVRTPLGPSGIWQCRDPELSSPIHGHGNPKGASCLAGHLEQDQSLEELSSLGGRGSRVSGFRALRVWYWVSVLLMWRCSVAVRLEIWHEWF